MKQFFMQNKVFITGLISSVVVVLQQYLSQPTVDYKVVGFAALVAALSYVANQWRGQGVTIFGIIGTMAGAMGAVIETGHFSWNQLFMSAIIALGAAVAPPPKDKAYEKTPVIANAKEGFSTTEKISGIKSTEAEAPKPEQSGK